MPLPVKKGNHYDNKDSSSGHVAAEMTQFSSGVDYDKLQKEILVE